MTGSSLVPVIVPIVAMLAMAVWLGLVFYAAAHPRWKRDDVLPGSATGDTAEQDLAVTGPEDRAAESAPARADETRPAAPSRRAA